MVNGLRRLCLAAPLLSLAGCGKGVLDPAGPVAAADRTILINALVIMLAIVVPTIIMTLIFAWWFRAGNARARYRPEFVFSGRIELIVWSIPILTILFLSGVIWTGSHQLDPAVPLASEAKRKAINVQVVSLDWKWLFIYPDQGVASVNRLVVPVGAPVRMTMTSASVLNTLYVPNLVSQVYVMNGMAAPLHLQADRPGVYYGHSGHFSGDGFSDMDFSVDAVPDAAFAGWVARARAAGEPLDAPHYALLARQSTADRPRTYRAVQAGLFDAVVHQQIAPAPGPQTGRGGPQVSPGDGS